MSEPSKEIGELEIALKALLPAAQLNRDDLIYRAGQASVSRRGWIWPACTAVMTMVTVALGLMLTLQPEPTPQYRVVFVPVPQEQPSAALPQKPLSEPSPMLAMSQESSPAFGQSSGGQLWQLEQQALRGGVDSLALPAVAETSLGEPRTIRELMNDFADGKFPPP